MSVNRDEEKENSKFFGERNSYKFYNAVNDSFFHTSIIPKKKNSRKHKRKS